MNRNEASGVRCNSTIEIREVVTVLRSDRKIQADEQTPSEGSFHLNPVRSRRANIECRALVAKLSNQLLSVRRRFVLRKRVGSHRNEWTQALFQTEPTIQKLVIVFLAASRYLEPCISNKALNKADLSCSNGTWTDKKRKETDEWEASTCGFRRWFTKPPGMHWWL
jgi:hypothetical protein